MEPIRIPIIYEEDTSGLVKAVAESQKLQAETVKLTGQIAQFSDEALQQTAVQIEAVKQAGATYAKVAALEAKIAASKAGSYNALSAEYELIQIRLKQLTAEERKATEEGKKLEASSKAIATQLKDMTKAAAPLNTVLDSTTKNLGEMKKELLALRNTSFAGKSAEEIAEINQRIGTLVDSIADLRSVQANLGDEFGNQIAGSLQVISAGVQGLVGTLNLLGVESETVKALEKNMIDLIGVTQALGVIEDALAKGTIGATIARIQHTAANISNTIAVNAMTRASIAQVVAQNSANIATRAGATAWAFLNRAIALSPIGAILTAVVALGGALYLLSKNTNLFGTELTELEKKQRTFEELNTEAKKSIIEERLEVERLGTVLTNENKTRAEKEVALKRLQEINPVYFKDLNIEKSTIGEINAAIGTYIGLIEQRAKFQAANSRLIETESKLYDLEERRKKAEKIGRDGSIGVFLEESRAATLEALFKEQVALENSKTGLLQYIKGLDETAVSLDTFSKLQEEKGKAMEDSEKARAKASEQRQKEIEKNAEKEKAAIEKLKGEYEKLREALSEDVQEVKLGNLSGVDKIREEMRIALEALDKFKAELEGKAKELKIDQDFSADFDTLAKNIKDNSQKAIDELVAAGADTANAFQKAVKAGLEGGEGATVDIDPLGSVFDSNADRRAKEIAEKISGSISSGVDAATESDTLTDSLDKLQDKLLDALNIDEAQAKEALSGIGDIVNDAFSGFIALAEAQITQQKRVVEARQKSVDDLEQQLEDEQALANQGFANNLDATQAKLDTETALLKKEEEKRLSLEKKAAQIRLRQEALQTASSIALSVAKVLAAESGKGLLGIITAAAAIASIFALIANAKAQAAKFSSPPQLREGARLEGASHEGGGIPIFVDGRHGYTAEGNEWLIGTRPSREHDGFLERLNDNEFSGMDLGKQIDFSNAFFDDPAAMIRELAPEYDVPLLPDIMLPLLKSARKVEKEAAAARGEMQRAAITEAFTIAFGQLDGGFARIERAISEQEVAIPITPDGYMLKKKSGNTTSLSIHEAPKRRGR